MALIDRWKTAKRTFETATGRKKPSAKFLGYFNKSSGIESALKTLDSALAKGVIRDVVTAKDAYHRTFSTYYTTLLKTAMAEANDNNYKVEVLKLNVALNGILRDADRALIGLDKMTVRDAIGPDAIAALGRSRLLSDANLRGWLNDPAVGMVEVEVEIGLQRIKDPASAAVHAQARKHLGDIERTFAVFTALLPKVMDRGKALDAAEKFIELVNKLVSGMDGSLSTTIGLWAGAQDDAIRRNDPDGAPAAIAAWHAKSGAWRHAVQLRPLWDNAADVRNDFRMALRKQGAMALN